MAVEARDLILIGLGALVFLALSRLPPRPAPLPVDRASLDALVRQLTTVQAECNVWRERAETAEARCGQLQAMVDNLLPAAVDSKQVIEAQRRQLAERAQELDSLKAGLGLR